VVGRWGAGVEEMYLIEKIGELIDDLTPSRDMT